MFWLCGGGNNRVLETSAHCIIAMESKLDCLAVIRAPLEQYPPSLNQVALLAEAGLRVGVVDLSHPDYTLWPFLTNCAVERIQPCRHTSFYKENPPNPAARLSRALKFQACVRRLIRCRQPKVVLAHDPPAMWAVGNLWREKEHPKLVWHFHELCLRSHKLSLSSGSRATNFAFQNGDQVDLITFPDAGRAEVFMRQSGLRKRPKVIVNCPRKLSQLPEDRLAARLSEHGLGGCQAVYFHGWIGPSRCLDVVLASMKYWPANAVFVVVGPIAKDYRQALLALAGNLKVQTRVLFIGSLPYTEVLHLAAGAIVGCSLVADEDDPNWVYSSGAINKRFEYMAVALPQVANVGHGMSEIIERTNAGILVDSASPDAVGKAINALLTNKALRHEMGESARKAHLDEYHYEHQFAPILDQIRKWVE